MEFRVQMGGEEALASPDLRRLLEYWHLKRDGREMPRRADIDPTELVWILGRVALVEVLPDGDFRWRLDGTRIAEFFRNDMTGRRLSEYPRPEMRVMMEAEYRAIVETRRPRVIQRTGLVDDRIWKYEILRLPLAADDGEVGVIMSGLAIQESWPAR